MAPLPSTTYTNGGTASAMHYFLVSICILAVNAPPDCVATVLSSTHCNPQNRDAIGPLLEYLALQICGIAFTTNIPSVLVNAYGPIAYCKY